MAEFGADQMSDIEERLAAIQQLTREKAELNVRIGEEWSRLQRHAIRRPEVSDALKAAYEAAASW
jgi:hypothetical protein